MKRAKRICALLGVLAVVCIVTVFVVKHEEKQENIRNSGEVVLEVDADSVQSISWENESDSLSFHKEDGWLYDDDTAFPVNEEKINELIGQFEAFSAAFIIEEVSDYSQYGLDNPICTIELATEETTYEITLGNYSAMDSQRYVSIGDGNVYLATNDPLDYFDATLSDMILNDETPSFDHAESIDFKGSDSYHVVYQEYTEDSPYTYCEDDVYFKENGEELLPLDTSLVNSYLSSITYLDLSDYMTYNAGEEDLATYGLDDPELTVTVQYTPDEEDGSEATSQTFTISISRDPEERQKAESTTDDSDSEDDEEEVTAYARIGDSKIIYKISSSSYESLMAASYNDLRHSEVLTASFDDITSMDISLDGTVYTITTDGKGENKTFHYGEEEISIDDLQSALEDMTASSFTDERPSQKEGIALTIYLDNEVHPQVEIQLYRYDGENCLVLIDGEPVSLVPRSDVVDLIEAINAIVL
ncbi:DUF4340 domain-containing protein [Pseudoflavonifractor sp. AF19-9AC]|uniref:DUF4340 domain-containing protein n=1 Tax=Pseudoflavonifractor sp. AF19-9AC TaxID=2292244 RepID=UPI000E48367A|nr:DUF4340 domain-containing protein [Pseudoflavonifractor sp. AF19-9AC]RHR10043.1 DUF4340 domain-containing protein [Pseudoflavonifractor sp. AF19-9AC]